MTELVREGETLARFALVFVQARDLLSAARDAQETIDTHGFHFRHLVDPAELRRGLGVPATAQSAENAR